MFTFLNIAPILHKGSNGSYAYLSTSERVELVENVRDILDDIESKKDSHYDNMLLMAGAGAEE